MNVPNFFNAIERGRVAAAAGSSKNAILWKLSGERDTVYQMLSAALDTAILERYHNNLPPAEAHADRDTHQTIVTANALICAASALLREANRKIERRKI